METHAHHLHKTPGKNMIIYYRQSIKNTRQIHYQVYDELNEQLLELLRGISYP